MTKIHGLELVSRRLLKEFGIPSFERGSDETYQPFRHDGLVFVGEGRPVTILLKVVVAVGESGFHHVFDFLTDVLVGHIVFDDDTAVACRIDDINAVGEFLLVLGSAPDCCHIF